MAAFVIAVAVIAIASVTIALAALNPYECMLPIAGDDSCTNPMPHANLPRNCASDDHLNATAVDASCTNPTPLGNFQGIMQVTEHLNLPFCGQVFELA
jgi:hypothetical protein